MNSSGESLHGVQLCPFFNAITGEATSLNTVLLFKSTIEVKFDATDGATQLLNQRRGEIVLSKSVSNGTSNVHFLDGPVFKQVFLKRFPTRLA